MLVKFL
jgi:hypothetical protein